MSPYIKQPQRKELEPFIEPLINRLLLMGKSGMVSYTLSRILISYFGTNYEGFQNMRGLLEMLLDEVKKWGSEYEDKKRKDNGGLI